MDTFALAEADLAGGNKFVVWFDGERIDTFDTLREAQAAIVAHPCYAKSKFTKRGDPTSSSSESRAFRIYDGKGYGWAVRP